MIKDFSQVMSEKTDKQLVEIISIKRDEYQVEALSAAEKEIERRNINVNIFFEENNISQPVETDKADLEFKLYHKILTVLFPAFTIALLTYVFTVFVKSGIITGIGFPIVVIIAFLIHDRLKQGGYTKMAKDFLKWITYTVYIYIGLILVLGLMIYFFFM